jgi:hypothetical protein
MGDRVGQNRAQLDGPALTRARSGRPEVAGERDPGAVSAHVPAADQAAYRERHRDGDSAQRELAQA